MRILIISTEFPPGPGGIGTHAYHLANEFTKKGMEVAVLTKQIYASSEKINTFNASVAFKVFTLYRHKFVVWNTIRNLLYLLRISRNLKPDLIMSSGSTSLLMGLIARTKRKTPWIVIGHGSEFSKNNPFYYFLLKKSFESADSVICVSNYTLNLMENSGISAKKAVVINNGANDNDFNIVNESQGQLLKKKYGLEEKFVLLTVGNVTERKGQEIIIRALPYIKKEIPGIFYIMVGLPTLKEPLLRLATELGVKNQIEFTGRVEQNELIEYYQTTDLFLMTSYRTNDDDVEGFGIAVIEAALCGKPAIVTAGSGLEEAVMHNHTGIVVPAQDPEAVAREVIALFKDQNRVKVMGEEARERALAGFTWKYCANQYINVIETMVN